MRWAYIVNVLRKLNKDDFPWFTNYKETNKNYRINFVHLFLT